MYETMRGGIKIWCEASVETRVQRLLEDYGREEYREEMVAALDRIRKKLGGDKYLELSGYLQRWELAPFVRELCVSYYDRNYYKVRDWVEDAVVSLEDYDEAAAMLKGYLGTRGLTKQYHGGTCGGFSETTFRRQDGDGRGNTGRVEARVD
jgi:tRNA 2-selenouridine synthase